MIDLDRFRDAIGQAKLAWRGCGWPTEFGPQAINLCGLHSRQAILASKATRGEESKCWKDAAQWLAEVERAAERAAELGELALHAAEANEFGTVDKLLGEAVALESKYHAPTTYQHVRDLCRTFLSDQPLC